MKRPGPFLILLVCWFAACAGVQLLHPEALLAWPGWWTGQWFAVLAQAAAVLISAWLLHKSGALAQWLALLAWWAWPWQSAAQWLRVTPLETAWHLAWVCWLLFLVQRRATGAWAATLALAVLNPASLSGAAAGLTLILQGRQRWVAAMVAGLAMLVEFQAPSLEQMGWAALALGVGLLSRQPAHLAVAFYTLVNAAKGGPTTAVLLALVVAWAVDRWRTQPVLLFLIGSWALAARGETALNRQVIVPWQQRQASLGEAFWPHSLSWWAEHIGPRYGFEKEDAEVCQWLRAQPRGPALVIQLDGWDDPFLARLYHQLSDGRALEFPSAWGAARVKSTRRLVGTGLNYLVCRGGPQPEGSVFSAGPVSVLGNDQPIELGRAVESFQIVERAGPGGEMTVRLQASGLVALGEDYPLLVLEPGDNSLSVPLHCAALSHGKVHLPAQDLGQQLERVVVSCRASSLPAHSVEVLDLLLENRSGLSLRLEGLALKARWTGEAWQPPVPLSGNVGQRAHWSFPLQTANDVSLRWLELVWQEPDGRTHPAARLRLALWPQQQAERYLNLKP